MLIHRSTILILFALLLMAPSLRDWVMQGGVAWYRMFVVWFFIIMLLAWNQRLIKRRGRPRA
ncbi:MAG TPA: hypothetical protein VLA24_07980 [Pseudomonadales bacterium]|nr:hypothetical protein [Pseudomonadales bacterium]